MSEKKKESSLSFFQNFSSKVPAGPTALPFLKEIAAELDKGNRVRVFVNGSPIVIFRDNGIVRVQEEPQAKSKRNEE